MRDVGDTWSYDGTFNFQDFGFEAELAERGSVTVGGRRFEGCSRWVTTIPVELPDNPGAEEVIEEWTCPGYGPVRVTDRFDPTDFLLSEELVEFHGEAGNWYADDASSPAERAAPVGAATAYGVDAARTNAVPDGALGADLAWTVERSVTSGVPPVGAGSLLLAGDTQGWVSATDVRTGEQVWQVRLTPPVLVAPAVAGNGVVVGDGDKGLRSLSLVDGHTQWVVELDDVVSQPPVVTDDAVVVASDDARVAALDVTDGSEQWSTTLGGRLTGAPAADGDHVYVSDSGGGLTALDLADGDQAWSRTIVESTLGAPALADGRVVAQDDDGVVYGFDAGDGTLEWQSRSRGNRSAPLAVAGETVLALTNTRDLQALDLEDGHRLWRTRVDVSATGPLVVGDAVVTVSTKGRLTSLDLGDGSIAGGFDLPRPERGQEPNVVLPLAVVDDSLVVTSTPGTGMADQISYAYPVRPGRGRGVLLDLEPIEIPSPPTEPATVLDDGSLLVAAFDGTLSRVDPGGGVHTLLSDDDRIATTGVVAGDLVVTRRADQLVAVPLEGGEPRWSVTVGSSYTGSVPAVREGTVYAGTSDGRFLAVDAEDGSVRWSAPVDPDRLPRSPLLLPSGDVVYGVGLTRYDAATGTPVWSLPDVDLAGAPVEAGGLVVGAASLDDGSTGLGAWDADTGQAVWFVPGSPDTYVGPAGSGETVVWGDGSGVVHALDARTGTELWSLDLHRPLGGVPVVRDGRVYLMALGRPEDADDRDVRVVVVDLGSGRFLASYEPSSALDTIVPPAGPGGPGTPLLVPTLATDYYLVQVAPHG